MGLLTEELQAWARAKPIHARLRLERGLGILVIRMLGPGAFLTSCPSCEAWINLPQTRDASKTDEELLLGPVSCAECETDLVLHARKVAVVRLGTPGKKRPAPPKPPREKKPRRRRTEVWDDDAAEYEP